MPHVVGNIGFVFTNGELGIVRDIISENKVKRWWILVADLVQHWSFKTTIMIHVLKLKQNSNIDMSTYISL